MKIAVAVKEDGKIFKGHFGSAPKYFIFNEAGKLLEEVLNPHDPRKTKVHHDSPNLIKELLVGVDVYLGLKFGEKSKQKLISKFGIVPVVANSDVPLEAVENFIKTTNG